MKHIAILIIGICLLEKVLMDFCKKPLMYSYFLEGLLQPDQAKIPICPSIKNNCCTEKDIEAVFENLGKILKPKRADFKYKFKRSVWNLQLLHAETLRLNQREVWTPPHKAFCQNRYVKLTNFPFRELASNLLSGFENTFDSFDKIHTSFLCVFCDHDAHKQMLLETSQLAQDGEVCLEIINKHSHFLQTQNIDLINYYMTLQTYLDCALYESSYNIPFVFGSQQDKRDDFTLCLKDVSPDALGKSCTPLCKDLRLAEISPTFEGNTIFMDRANNFYSDQISSIILRQNSTLYDPLKTIKDLRDDETIKFHQMPIKSMNRIKGIPPWRNIGVPESDFDPRFRNDLRIYRGEESENHTGTDDPRPGALIPRTFRKRQEIKRPPSQKCGLFGCGFKLPSINLGGLVSSIGSAVSGVATAAKGAVKTAKRAIPNIKKFASKGAKFASGALGGIVNKVKKIDINKVISTVTKVAGVAKGAAGLFNSVMDGPLGMVVKMAVSAVPGGGAILAGVQMASKVVANLPVPVPKRKLIFNSDDLSITMVEPDGSYHFLKEGQMSSDGYTNVFGKLYKNMKPVKIQYFDEKGDLLPVPKQSDNAKKSKKQKTNNKLEFGSHKNSERRLKSNFTGKKVISEFPVLQVKKISDVSLKFKNETPNFLTEISSMPSKIPEFISKTNIETPQNFPRLKKEILAEVSSLIKQNFRVPQKNKKSGRLNKSIHHRRILADLLANDPFNKRPSITKKRVLVEDDHPNPKTNPIGYYTKVYESFQFLLNSTSREIFKNCEDYFDFTKFGNTITMKQGINTNEYVSSMNFELNRQQLMVLLMGKHNIDIPDSQLHSITNHCDLKFKVAVFNMMFTQYSILVQPDHMSLDDVDFLRETPEYSQSEDFEQIDTSFFDNEFLVGLHGNLPTANIQRKDELKKHTDRKLIMLQELRRQKIIVMQANRKFRHQKLIKALF